MAIRRDKTREYLESHTKGSPPPKQQEITHQQIVDLLVKYYHSDRRQWLCIPEMRVGTGYGKTESRQIDLFALNCYPTKGHKTIAYEVKISRGDFRRDIKKPDKQRGARLYANQVYYVAPAGLLKLEDIPLWAGLIEVVRPKGGGDFVCRIRREPVKTERLMPSWGFICSLLRRLPDATI